MVFTRVQGASSVIKPVVVALLLHDHRRISPSWIRRAVAVSRGTRNESPYCSSRVGRQTLGGRSYLIAANHRIMIRQNNQPMNVLTCANEAKRVWPVQKDKYRNGADPGVVRVQTSCALKELAISSASFFSLSSLSRSSPHALLSSARFLLSRVTWQKV